MKTLILCGVAAALASPAVAATRPQVSPTGYLQMTVSYADLDLSRPAGAKIMAARIRRAAKLVCGQDFHADLDRARHAEACTAQATRDALAQVDAASGPRAAR